MSEKYKGLIALVAATFIGGAILPSLIRTGVSTIHPAVFTFFRTGLSLMIILLFTQKSWKNLIEERWKLPKVIFLLGLTLAGNLLLFSIGVAHTTLIASQLMYVLLPITTGIVGLIWLKEKMPLLKIIGAVIAIIGVTVLVIFSQKSSQQLSLGTFFGNITILGAVCCYTMYFIFSKKFSQTYSPLVMSALSSAGVTLFLLPIAAWIILKDGLNTVSTESWLSVLAIGFASTIFYFLVQYGIKRLSTMTGAIITQLSPEFAALAGIFVFNEQLSVILVLSLLLVTIGVTLSVQSEKISLWERFKTLISKVPIINKAEIINQ